MSKKTFRADHLFYFNAEKMAEQFGTEKGCRASANELQKVCFKKLKYGKCDEEFNILVKRQQFFNHTIHEDGKRDEFDFMKSDKLIAPFKEFTKVFYELAKLVYELKDENCDENAVLNQLQTIKEKFEDKSSAAEPDVKIFYDYFVAECEYFIWKYFMQEEDETIEWEFLECIDECPEEFYHDGSLAPPVCECGLPF